MARNATYTENLNLTKDNEDEFYDVNIVNENLDKIDNWSGEVNSQLNAKVYKTGIYDNILLSPKSTPKYVNNSSKNNVYELLFYLPDTDNFQGMTFYDGYFYCGFDIGSGNGKIVKYDLVGNKISETPSMAIGHCAELGYRKNTNTIYVANGGGSNPTHVYEVDFDANTINNDLNFESLGTSALLAIDNIHDYLILHTSKSGDSGNPIFTIINLGDNSIINTFTIYNQGVPQGLESDGKYIYLYTNNKVTVIDYEGNIVESYSVDKSGESEGITMATEGNTCFLALGYNSPNRIYALRTSENEKIHNIQLLNSVNLNSQGQIPLLPRMFCFPLKITSGGIWGIPDWVNLGSTSNIIDSITQGSNDIKVKLKTKFSSILYFNLAHNRYVYKSGVYASFNVDSDGKTLKIEFLKDGVNQDPSSLLEYSTVYIMVVGGVDLDY